MLFERWGEGAAWTNVRSAKHSPPRMAAFVQQAVGVRGSGVSVVRRRKLHARPEATGDSKFIVGTLQSRCASKIVKMMNALLQRSTYKISPSIDYTRSTNPLSLPIAHVPEVRQTTAVPHTSNLLAASASIALHEPFFFCARTNMNLPSSAVDALM